VKIEVTVAVRAGSPTWARCLQALRAEGVEPLVFAVPHRHGLAQARNDALAASKADVLAFVDDDVAVEPGWRAALQHAWAGAPADRGCIGGPIRARFEGPRPPWLTDALLGVLGVAAGGQSFHGGNVSFRTEALRGIEGFWPARGRPELHDWFSEEHHAQHELAAAGWTDACEPGAAAARIIDPERLRRRDVLVRRARYGARSALIGERRPRAAAARIAASSAAGAAVAAVRGDGVRATERAARAAENAAVLLAGVIAHRDLQPTVAQTPFRHSVPAPQPVFRARRTRHSKTGAVVLLYHRVDDRHGSVTPANFTAQIEMLLSRYTPAPLESIVSGDAAPDAFAVTFDDGYAETMRRALPVLTSAGVPATIFVSTDHVATQRSFWWDEVRRLLGRARDRPVRLTIDGDTRAWARAGAAEDHLVAWLQPKAPEVIDEGLAELRAWAADEPAVPEAERPLNLAELRALSASSIIDVGAHTRTHANLRYVDDERLMQELAGSREDLEHWLDIESPCGLAYPFGIPGADVNADTRCAARSAGFRYAVLNSPGTVTADTDRYGLPRLPVENAGADAFASLISRATGRPNR
jgi:peptidoglycan/xylan/chitin deacetylase (PgdA/CDA1 family)